MKGSGFDSLVHSGRKKLLIAKNFHFLAIEASKRSFAQTLKLPMMHFLVEFNVLFMSGRFI